MARILIRPEDLARLARRFDAAAEDLARAGRRLSHSRDEVRLNRADESFPVAQFVERSRLVEANLRRLVGEFQVDAGLMARTVDDAGFDTEFDGGFGGAGRWTTGLTRGPGGPGSAEAEAAAAAAARAPTEAWSSVAAGLVALGPGSSPSGEGGSPRSRSVGAGGLFRISSAGGGDELLDRLTERLGRASRPGPAGPAGGVGDSAAGGVWTRIVGELFAVEPDP